MAEKKNYYEILGVSETASEEEIRAAYKKLVKQYHPDLHPGDAQAAEKFKELNEANEVLSDKQKRAAYDYERAHPGMNGDFGGFRGNGFQGFGGFEDIFSTIFQGFGGGGGQPDNSGEDIHARITLSFLDAAKGCRRDITYTRNERCSACRGTGAKDGSSMRQCDQCGGAGRVRIVQNTPFGRAIREGVCPKCGGKGRIIVERCPVCKGRGYSRTETKVTVDIPAGVDNTSYMRKAGFGQAGENGGAPGDLIIEFRIEPHKLFRREGYDLYLDLPVPFLTAALGGVVKIPSIDEAFDFTIPEGTQSGKEFVIPGRGIKGRGGTGALHVRILVEVPTRLTKEQRKALSDVDDGMDLKQFPQARSYADSLSALYGEEAYRKD